ncbi:hypothetical protein QZH41_015411 [Actinostola sp. cb2023]|nr:hypothetical protein QZH41_015411 [Actinostola sp. cb2023]
MVKRKRESTGASAAVDSGAKTHEENPDQESSSSGVGRDRKRRKLSSTKSSDPADICAELYELIRNYRTEDGRIMCESLIRVPKRRTSPEYYEVVSSPIDLLKIQQRLKTDEYEDVETFIQDVELLLDNAMKFYKPDSQEYNDAEELKEIFEEKKELLLSGKEDGKKNEFVITVEPLVVTTHDDDAESDSSSVNKDKTQKDKAGGACRQSKKEPGMGHLEYRDDDDESSTDGESNMPYFEDMLGTILEQKDSHGRIICELFKRLPPKDLYPEYYEVIKEPIDLKTICMRVRSHYYSLVEDLEKDLQIMVKNAHTFNEPGSQVYKDASTIKKLIQTKKAEIDHTVMGAKSSSRLKARRSTGQISSAISSLLEEEDDQAMYQAEPMEQEDQQYEDSSHGDDDGIGDDDTDNPLMMLFNEIYKHTDATGRPMIEPFLRLPSRRAYPDYYEVIKKPIAMMKIRSQIKSGYYESVEALDNEMELCFTNAQTYNEPNSMLFKDAERMLEQLKRKKADTNKMIQEKGINLEDFLKKKKKVQKDVDPSETLSTDDDSSEVAKPLPPEYKQIKEMKTKKKVTADGKPKKKKTDDVDPLVLKKRMRQLAKAVLTYQDENARHLCAIFMDLPSSEVVIKEYPDYYKVISEPVCLSQIEANIRDNKYSAEDELLLDFEVMFDNARYFNEEDSQVYQDACVLEKVLKKKRKSLGPINPGRYADQAYDDNMNDDDDDRTLMVMNVAPESGPSAIPSPVAKMTTPTKSGRISSSPGAARKYYQVPSATNELKELCKELLTAVKDCTDNTGRQLCLIFQKLPSRAEYPDYYTLIKKPIDMAKIQSKLNSDQYQTLDDFMSDFHLMFDNACRYNEPDSQVYKDALSLLRSLLRKKAELVGDENKIPHVPFLLQKILNTLYDSTLQHVDEEGRCFSDSLVELSVKHGGNKVTLESIGEHLKKMYDDAVELQVHFVNHRDKLCKDGERFISPALLITRRHLVQELDDEHKKKAELEGQEDEKLKAQEKKEGKDTAVASDDESGVKELFLGETQYSVGDFVYVELREDKLQPHVVLVEKLWTDTSGEKWLYGNWYYRPEETFHLATRKFLEKASLQAKMSFLPVFHVGLPVFHVGLPVFHVGLPVFHVGLPVFHVGLPVFHVGLPVFHVGFPVFHVGLPVFHVGWVTCEVFKSDYSSPSKLSKVLGKCYVVVVKDYFKQKPEGFKDEDVYVCESRYSIRTKSFKKIKSWPSQVTNATMVARDVVLTPKRVPSVFAPNEEQKAVVTDTDDSDDSETDSKKNVPLDNNPNVNDGCIHYEQHCLGDVPYKLGDCVYLRSDEDYQYIARIDRLWTDRNGNTWLHGPWFIGPGETQHLPTKMFHEQEVYLSSLEETLPINSIVGKCMVLSIRDYTRCRPTEIAEKDIYLNEARYDEEEGQFRKLKGLKRYSLSLNCYEEEFYYFEDSISPLKVPSPLLFEDQDMMAAGDRSVSPSTSVESAESGKKQKKPRSQSAYLLFAYERRLSLRREHPEYVFGEISRVIGEEWRNATAAVKAEFEAKAQLQLSQADNEARRPPSHLMNAHRGQSSTSMFVYDCSWRGCDYQYEDLQDLRVHVLDSANHLKKAEDGLYHCCWTTCTRERRGYRPFNSSAKLFRHCREIHLIGPPRIVAPLDRSKNYFPRHQAPILDSESDPSPPSPRISTPSGTPVSSMGISTGGIMGMGQNITQGIQGHYQQPGTVQTPSQYLTGRLTPQAMQQGGMYGSSNNTNSPYNQQQQPMQQNNSISQRQMPMGGNVGMNMNQNMQQQTAFTVSPGQSPGYQQQQFNQTQQFNFQQQVSPINQMGQISPSTPQVPQMNPLQQMTQMSQYQTQTSNQHQQLTQSQAPTQHLQAQAPAQPPIAPPEVTAPIFVAAPSKPQRLHHSEAYLRYIEGLRDGNPHMSNWNQSRKPDASTMTPQQMAQLPVHWLGNGYGDYDNPVDALWALKEHMMRDALSLSHTGEN